MNYSIEIERNNVTVSAFLASIRAACKTKGIDCDIDTKEFRKPYREYSNRYYVKDGIKYCNNDGYESQWDGKEAPCQSEICKVKPYDWQTYILNFDGTCYNEICEFTFDDEKTGHGYYFQCNKD